MSDFDTVLERLLSDPGFKAALAADPARALAGYQLSPDEVELLGVQVSGDAGGNSQVEQRTSKASLFGMLGSMAGAGFGHHGDSAGFAGASQGVSGGTGQASIGDSWSTVSEGPAHTGVGGATAEIGTPMGGHVAGIGSPGGGGIGAPLDHVVHSGQGGSVPAGYHPHVDADGDGKWDQYTVRGRADGGVDIYVDIDHDGRADFVGHDYNRDGIIDSADYDSDHDGRFDTHMTDTNGDGWMDTSTRDPRS